MAQGLSVGTKDILLWKLIYAVICSVLSQVIFLLMFIFVLNMNVFQPFNWITSSFTILTSLSTILCLLPLGSIIFAQGIICSKNYVFESPYRSNRIMKILGTFSFRNLVILLLHIITGVLIVWLYLNLIGGNGSFYNECNKNYCVVEETFLLLLNGFWIGLFYFFKKYVSKEKSIQFPVIQQGKYLSVKLRNRLKQALKEAVWPTVYFLIIYYYRGGYIRDSFTLFFNMPLDKKPLNFWDICNSMLLVYSWLFSTLFIFTMLSMEFFFELFLTEHWKFPILTDSDDSVLKLKNALQMNNIPIVQHLACLDLYILSLWDPVRRQQLFTLSQPGGHPHTWNGVVQEILKLLKDFSSEISQATDAILTPEIITKPMHIPKEDAKLENSYYNFHQPMLNETILRNPYHSPLRNMSLQRREEIDFVNITQNDVFTNTIDSLKKTTISKFNQIVDTIKRRSGLQYLIGDLPESRIYFLLRKGQPIIWAIEGLSQIVTASFTEDKYGVVQKDLPVIITVLMNLKQNLDKLNKLTVVNRRSSQADVYKTQLKVALRTAVRRSLYNMCNVFGKHLSQIPLSKEVGQQLQNFMLYKEG